MGFSDLTMPDFGIFVFGDSRSECQNLFFPEEL